MDFDDPATPNAQIEYSITLNKELDGKPMFWIDSGSGKIFTMVEPNHRISFYE